MQWVTRPRSSSQRKTLSLKPALGHAGIADAGFNDTVFRWEDDRGRVTHCTYQELWADTYQRAMTQRSRRAPA